MCAKERVRTRGSLDEWTTDGRAERFLPTTPGRDRAEIHTCCGSFDISVSVPFDCFRDPGRPPGCVVTGAFVEVGNRNTALFRAQGGILLACKHLEAYGKRAREEGGCFFCVCFSFLWGRWSNLHCLPWFVSWCGVGGWLRVAKKCCRSAKYLFFLNIHFLERGAFPDGDRTAAASTEIPDVMSLVGFAFGGMR